jgi:hypothetical protein
MPSTTVFYPSKKERKWKILKISLVSPLVGKGVPLPLFSVLCGYVNDSLTSRHGLPDI